MSWLEIFVITLISGLVSGFLVILFISLLGYVNSQSNEIDWSDEFE